MKKLINFFVLFYLIAPLACFSQSNFTIEWESPVVEQVGTFASIELSNQIPEIYTYDYVSYKIYDGATHQLKYMYLTPDSARFNFPHYKSSEEFFDVNNDGIGDMISYKSTSSPRNCELKVINGANGQIIWQNTYSNYNGHASYEDIDGDSFLELIVSLYDASYNYKMIILSTPSHSIGIIGNQNNVTNFNLKQNYPNPFNPATTIEYSIAKDANVQILLYNELGQLIKTFEAGNKKAGNYKVTFDGTDIASGVYFYQLSVDGNLDTKKMVLTK